MKIVHISWEFPPNIVGGLGTFVTELSEKLVLNNNEVRVYTINKQNRYPTDEVYNGVDVYRPRGVDFTTSLKIIGGEPLRRWGDEMGFFSDVIVYNILSAADAINRKSDIVVSHDWLGAPAGIAIKEDLSIPFVFHLHSTERGRSMGGGSSIVDDMEHRAADVADKIITVSYVMKDNLTSMGFPRDKIEVCWNGVDECKYDPDRFSEYEKTSLRRRYEMGQFMLLFVGRLTPVKGIWNLVEAMPSILCDFPGTKLIIVGRGELENDLISLIKNLNLEDNIVIRSDFLSEREKLLHYAASDVVVLPSTYEPFGIVCTEAMSMGKPVVVGARGVSGLREQVISSTERQCGVHINPESPRDIAWGVNVMLSSRESMERFGRNARNRVLEDFTWNSVVEKNLRIYSLLTRGF